MAKSKKGKVDGKTLPAQLQKALETAEANRLPPEDGEDANLLPDLWALLAPREVRLSAPAGQAEKVVYREPMLSLFWSRQAGAWALSITDRVLKVKAALTVESLAKAMLEASEAIRDGRVDFKQLD